MKMIIPLEIKRRIMRKTIARISVFFGILILLLLTFLLFQPLAQLEWNNKVLTFALCLILDAVVTGVPHKLLRRCWQGEVVGVNVKTTTESSRAFKPTDSSWYTANTVILTLKTPKEKIIFETVEKTKSRHSQTSIDRYEKGDYVARINEVEYPAHYDLSSNQTRCVICGSYSSNDLNECKKCGNALVTFDRN